LSGEACRGPKHLVLVGGGHAHVFVLEAFARNPEPGVAITLVAKVRRTPYSGMLPGHVAGLYPRAAMEIDLAPLARAAGARFIEDEAAGFDAAARAVRLAGGGALSYDVLSVDIGITPDLSGLPGAAEHGVAVKPIGDFLAKWDHLRAEALRPGGPRRIAVVGGGAAGLCLVFAAAASLRRGARDAGLDPAAFAFSLVSAAAPPELNEGMRRQARRALERQGIGVHAGSPAVAVGPEGIGLADGGFVPADRVLVSTQAQAPPVLAASAFAKVEGGFLAVTPTLQTLFHPEVFAAGDCATLVEHPRPKAGVFAVRQGPPLARNLRRFLRGEALEAYLPQARHLLILSTADGRGIAGRGRWFSYEGRAAWWLKDWIDRRFVRRFHRSGGGSAAQEMDDA
jgi:selenide,water dikinase